MTARPLSQILADFTAAAERVSAMAGDWKQGQFRARDLTDADTVLRGMSHCLAELRAKGVQDEGP